MWTDSSPIPIPYRIFVKTFRPFAGIWLFIFTPSPLLLLDQPGDIKNNPQPEFSDWGPCKKLNSRLLSQVHQLTQQRVGRGNDSGIGLKTSLHRDHIHQFIAKIHIGGFQGIGKNFPK